MVCTVCAGQGRVFLTRRRPTLSVCFFCVRSLQSYWIPVEESVVGERILISYYKRQPIKKKENRFPLKNKKRVLFFSNARVRGHSLILICPLQHECCLIRICLISFISAVGIVRQQNGTIRMN